MPYAQTPDKYSVYVPQGSKRTTFSHFNEAGVDLFSSPGSQNENGYLALQNVLPSVSGGFQRRWGLSVQGNLGLTSAWRYFPYQVSAEGTVSGVFYSGFANYYSFFATDNLVIKAVYNEGTNDGQEITGFSGSGQVYATTSRDFMYAFNGVDAPQKKHFAILTDTQRNIGFIAPNAGISGTVIGPPFHSGGTGKSYNPGTTTITATDTSGAGSGATFNIVSIDSKGTILLAGATNIGSSYNPATTTVSVVDSSGAGSGATFIPVFNSTGGIIVIVPQGPMLFEEGRAYYGAYINSKTGHASDVTYLDFNAGTSNIPYTDENGIPQSIVGSWTNINFDINLIESPSLDPQIDTFLLMATSDGGDTEHLYEVAQIPLSSFTSIGGGIVSFSYSDTLPDTYTDNTSTGNTLLENNLWVDVDGFGDIIGIFANTPPPSTLNKPITNQGRMFATDGKSVFFSKNLNEVTTSTGLITSKWEEAWPASNRLDIGFDNEVIVGLLSDTTFLYIGTTQNIYRLSGTDINSFNLQCIFRNVGLLNQDCWTVVYKENLPAGYVWITPDNKVIFSDFNNYNDVGVPIYPSLIGDTCFSVQSWVHGPYAMAFIRTKNNTFWVLNLSTNSWIRWTPTLPDTTAHIAGTLTYTKSNGLSNLWVTITSSTLQLGFLDPTSNVDNFPSANTTISWNIQTGWQDLGDTTNMKVVNEVEAWSDEGGLSVEIFSKSGNTSSAVANSVTAIQGPIGVLQDCYKAYFAAYPTGGKFFSFSFTGTNLNTSSNILDQFVVEHFPFGRF